MRCESWAGLAGWFDYENIVLIGPNHFGVGENNIAVSNAVWKTPFGDLEPNFQLIA